MAQLTKRKRFQPSFDQISVTFNLDLLTPCCLMFRQNSPPPSCMGDIDLTTAKVCDSYSVSLTRVGGGMSQQ